MHKRDSQADLEEMLQGKFAFAMSAKDKKEFMLKNMRNTFRRLVDRFAKDQIVLKGGYNKYIEQLKTRELNFHKDLCTMEQR